MARDSDVQKLLRNVISELVMLVVGVNLLVLFFPTGPWDVWVSNRRLDAAFAAGVYVTAISVTRIIGAWALLYGPRLRARVQSRRLRYKPRPRAWLKFRRRRRS